MKKVLTLFLFAAFGISSLFAAPFYVRVNGATDYAATASGNDYQGRAQYAAASVPLSAGDVITCYDAENQAEWAVTALDPYGAYANFTTSAGSVACNTEGCYNIYIKLKYQDDMLYIEEGSGCNGEPPAPPTSRPVNEAVLLQGFYWDSNMGNPAFGFTRWNDLYAVSGDISANFDYVWLPPSAFSTGGTGYIPRQWSNQYSDWGTEPQLIQLINAMKENGCKSIADIVVNHRADNGEPPYNQFYPDNFGEYGQFQLLPSDIIKNDDANCENAPNIQGGGNFDSGEDFCGARDLDHYSANVKNAVKAYLKYLKNVIGYDGWRWDMVKGFRADAVGEYNDAAGADISVGEHFSSYGEIKTWIDNTNQKSMAFDFALKYKFKEQFAYGNYSAMFSDVLAYDAYYKKFAVTFIDNHDTYPPHEFPQQYTGDILKAYAFLLASPGIPCVFYPHWHAHKEAINAMVKARKSAGISSETNVQVQLAEQNNMKLYAEGSCGKMLTFIGNTEDLGGNWTLAASGGGYKIYTEISDSACIKIHQQGIDNASNPIIDDTPIGTITITANVPQDWTAPKIYIWGMASSTEYACSWSGSPMANVGANKFSYTVNGVADSEIGVVINNGLTGSNIKQTVDIQNVKESTCFELSATANLGGKHSAAASATCTPIDVAASAPCSSAVGETAAGKITLYPNPATDELRIKNYELQIKGVQIFDIAGRLISNLQFTNYNSIEVRNLNSGVYLIKIYTDKGTITERFIKI